MFVCVEGGKIHTIAALFKKKQTNNILPERGGGHYISSAYTVYVHISPIRSALK